MAEILDEFDAQLKSIANLIQVSNAREAQTELLLEDIQRHKESLYRTYSSLQMQRQIAETRLEKNSFVRLSRGE